MRHAAPAPKVHQMICRGRAVWLVSVGSHGDLLARETPEAAKRDGLAYFLRTRECRHGKWVLRVTPLRERAPN